MIKIDRSFTSDVYRSSEARAVVQAILGIAQSLECDVVAEGVETEAQAGTLGDMGCRHMQGFLFARPLSPAAMERQLDLGRAGADAAAML